MKPIELTDDILLNVARPARYIGQEHNIIIKEWSPSSVKVCLCYPDVYEVGMSHIGLKILYHILNKKKDIICERSFTPWLDMEDKMRQVGIPLFSLENKMPLGSFDIIGFSLQYELTYTNLLNMLSLSGIPFFSADRKEKDFPLIIAGGPCAFNPEPLADFIDLFLIGDGEEAVLDIIQVYRRFRKENEAEAGPFAKEQMLKEMAKIEGVYVPSFYDISYLGERIKDIKPKFQDIPLKVKKAAVKRLDNEDFPSSPIVPYISTVHDRISIEIMRGCPNNCRFCQARSIYNPARIRSQADILELVEQSCKNTGLDEVSLVSLSSSNYPGIENLLASLSDRLTAQGVGISLPSLRIEEELDKLPFLISRVRKTGLTFAPEAGTEKMLKVINKNISYEQLFQAIKAAYRMGWRRVKLYFMIGLPFEEEKDVEAIIDLAEKIAMLKKEVSGPPADVTVNISSFIPKPHTPFQWMDMATRDELKDKQDILFKKASGKRYLKLKLHNLQTSILEAIFSRGGRRLGPVLLDAWKQGARFDAWGESFDPSIWDEAFRKNRIDKNLYLAGTGNKDLLPWEHISCGIDKERLTREYNQAIDLFSSKAANQ
jgi:radical SAM family uncharacterized protein